MTFSKLQLDPPLLKAVEEAGYTQPSPIQQKAIPPVLTGRDLLACAQTGTGKTAAFALPILQRLSHRQRLAGTQRVIRALVLTPTRELALQIQENFEIYAAHLPLRSTVIFGGVGQAPQVQQLKRGVDVLVATPGRLNDLIGQGYVKLGALECFVLDEADRMLDMGFVHDVNKVIKQLPKIRQNLLFSATIPPEIVKLAEGILHNPVKVFVTPTATTVERINQKLYKVDKTNKRHLLAKLLREDSVYSALVFTRTKHGADRVVRELKRESIPAMAIHGNKSQTARQTALTRFKAGQVTVLVATDIAARGLDINELSHVFNYELPNIPETYVHRIGRTGRAGHGGDAVSFCCHDELPYLADIEKLIGFKIPEETRHPWPMSVMEAIAPIHAVKDKDSGKHVKPVSQAVQTAQTAPAAKHSLKKVRQAAEKALPTRKAAPPTANPRPAGNAIVTKRPVWAQPAGTAGAEPKQGETDMLKNNQRRRDVKPRNSLQGASRQPGTGNQNDRAAAPSPQQKQAAPARRVDATAGSRRYQGGGGASPQNKEQTHGGLFDFSEEELARDDSMRLISETPASGDAKYASFEDYLKDH